MEIGISSSCFYPLELEASLKKVGELGCRTAEIFVNSFCELKSPVIDELCRIKDYYGIDIRSLHPFTSAYEPLLFFSEYRRRTDDGVEFYKMYFDAVNKLGAEILVLHGGLCLAPITSAQYIESYAKLHLAARAEGLYIAHENVNKHNCADPLFMKTLADAVGEDFRAVLDIKQCRRSGNSEFDFIKLLGVKIAQVHLSDCLPFRDCLAPGTGRYDFQRLFSALRAAGYDKSGVIELYRKNFGSDDELKAAKSYLESVLNSNPA